jgi:hypothetical protein
MRTVTGRWQALACFIGFLVLGFCAVQAQRHRDDSLGEVETNWPGIRYQLTRIERISSDRLLVVVRIVATQRAPASGTFIGIKAQVPANVPKEEVGSAKYAPRPFSLASSQMVGDQTGQRYPALPPIASGRQYIPGEILTTLRPGQAEVLTVQFAAPASLSSVGSSTPKQTASFLFPNAKGPIGRITIPPPAGFDDPTAQNR